MSHKKSYFTYPDDASGFSAAARHFLHSAQSLGWTLRWGGKTMQMVQCYPPGGGSTIAVPKTSINANRERSWARALRQHSDADVDTVLRETWPQYARTEAASKPTAPKPEPPPPAPSPEPEEPRLVSEKPWMARFAPTARGQGRLVQSATVLERLYLDGSTLYACRECDYSSANPRSVATHAGKSHPEASVPREERPVVVAEYTPTGDTRSGRLHRLILGALSRIEGWQEMAEEELARTLAEALRKRHDDDDDLSSASRELTPEEIIARIARLVDNGRYDQTYQSLQEAEQNLLRLNQEMGQKDQVIERLREERRALSALLAEED